MRNLVLALFLAHLPIAAHAETLSAEIARTGLAATEARLASASSLTPDEQFTLGGVQFLRAVEQSYQIRWQTGLSDPTGLIPLLRLPVPPNPAPQVFDPATLVTIFIRAAVHLGRAQTTLSAIPPDADFGVEIALSDLWFDVDSNGTRTEGEGLLDIAGPALLGWAWAERDPAAPTPTIRFDAADAAWLAAYAHLLNGVCDVIRAYDPTEAVAKVVNARAKMQTLAPLAPDMFFGAGPGIDAVDILAMITGTLNQTPDPVLMASAQGHFLDMVAQNRLFWARVATETDNQNEWLPNDAQTSALGLPLAPGTGTAWLQVLVEVEAILKGEKLVPFWRLDTPAGVNVGRMFTDPTAIDLFGWVQGWAALPYLETGPMASPESLRAFSNMVQGDPMLLALFLN